MIPVVAAPRSGRVAGHAKCRGLHKKRETPKNGGYSRLFLRVEVECPVYKMEVGYIGMREEKNAGETVTQTTQTHGRRLEAIKAGCRGPPPQSCTKRRTAAGVALLPAATPIVGARV